MAKTARQLLQEYRMADANARRLWRLYVTQRAWEAERTIKKMRQRKGQIAEKYKIQKGNGAHDYQNRKLHQNYKTMSISFF